MSNSASMESSMETSQENKNGTFDGPVTYLWAYTPRQKTLKQKNMCTSTFIALSTSTIVQ